MKRMALLLPVVFYSRTRTRRELRLVINRAHQALELREI